MRRTASALAGLVLLASLSLPTIAPADDALRIAGAALGPDGLLTRKAADVMGNDGPSHTALLAIEDPPLRAGSRIEGRVEVFEVDSEAWLELAAVYPDGHREVARTLDAAGPAARLRGTAAPRRFELAVPAGPEGAKPVRLELGVGMLGPGVVSVSELRLQALPETVVATAARPSTRGLWITMAAAAAAGAVALRSQGRAPIAER